MKDKLLQIVSHYGIDKQLKYIHSEYFELDEAILEKEKVGAYPGVEEKKHIIEEIADVIVMLKQFQYYYGIEDKQIEDIMEYKIDRQLDRIEAETSNVSNRN
jgi:NTP pyrophosphatase (non-canonical NTP hydrolase)